MKRFLRLAALYLDVYVSPFIYGRLIKRTRRDTGEKQFSLLISAPGAGNIGDQAMAESFMENVRGRIVIVTKNAEDVVVPVHCTERVHILPLPALIYGRIGRRHFLDMKQYAELLRGASSVSVVGADIMDGAYNPKASIRRSVVARASAESGVSTRILGFSWNGTAHHLARRALTDAATRGVELFARDPLSYRRCKADGIPNVSLSADTVFCGTWENTSRLHGRQAIRGKRRALVNISAHVENTVPQLANYDRILQKLDHDGFEVILVPHVSRPGSDDIALAKQLAEFSGVECTVLETLCHPSEVRALCSSADLIFTGRMHLSIMGLSRGVPSIVMSTQGKVQGLTDFFPDCAFSVTPSRDFASEVVAIIDELVATPRRVSADDLSRVSELSEKNFQGLSN
ncbi:polysaccharide pyruvyl transferase family protein [Arthrobacter crystallopoietes]|uniref:polysaccharide pyruvyl transferase family protein n=1 Tax=Crystallibacter crystallopoietes TaxID=37928 RepID=UPI003D1C49B7